MFRTNLSQFYKELNGTDKEKNVLPDPDKATNFWSDIWSVPSFHNQNGRWWQKEKQELTDIETQKDINITVESNRIYVSGK